MSDLSRRHALKLLAAQTTMLIAGCSKPREEIVPYVRMPEGLTPGVATEFATTAPLGGFGRGVLVKSVEGRPIKVEGNAQHPASLGATDVFAEALVLSLYDPDRSQAARRNGEISSWAAFEDALAPPLSALAANGGQGLWIVTGPMVSPTLLRQSEALKRRFPALRWAVHDPLAVAAQEEGARLAFGRPLRAVERLAEADVVLTLDADPLGPGPLQVANTFGFAARRRERGAGAAIGRLYAIESTATLTGANADHRIAMTPAQIANFAMALAKRMGAQAPQVDLDPATLAVVEAIGKDLRAHPGRALVVAGPTLSAEIHALCHAINGRLNAPIDYFDIETPATATLTDLIADLQARSVEALFILDANPAYDGPPGFEPALSGAAFRAHFGGYFDETAAVCEWHLPLSHALESWSDFRAPQGAASLAQPLIAPLYDTRSIHEALAALAGEPAANGYDIVRQTWTAVAPTNGFEPWWRRALESGIVNENAAKPVSPPSPAPPQLKAGSPASGLALVLRPDPSVFDGAFANNAWLQELPKPLTKEVWGAAVGVSRTDAAKLGVADGDFVRIAAGERVVDAPVRIDPRAAVGVLGMTLGYGRRAAGAIGTGLGANAFSLRSASAEWVIDQIVVTRTGQRKPLVSTQEHFALEGETDELFPHFTVGGEVALPDTAKALPTFYADRQLTAPAWGMVIDTTLCTGCNACVVACQVENNSPVIGPEQILVGRDMHWLRIDAYEIGTAGTPSIGFQPVPCMQCEAAPCEPVCPVEASVHDHQGLNVQVYNRCIGTRFCQANCPYKVRRFNFFGYADGEEFASQGAEALRAHNNPDVTVRGRGVMEKCTYCVQRISRARHDADRETREIADGEVVTACQAACPTRAITFGDISRANTEVAAKKRAPEHYSLLGHLGTRPRTTYLAQIRNPNPELTRKT